jgi:prepilin peptidase CpaA
MSIVFEGSLWSRFETLTLVAVLAAACVMDLRTRRIPNELVLTGLVAGVGFALLDGGLRGMTLSIGGAATGLCIWLPFWLLRMMGGGDVKLFAAGAAWLGPGGAVEAAMLAGLCGGVLSLLYVLQRYGVTHTLFRLVFGMHHPQLLREPAPVKWNRHMPYALAIAAGLAGAAYWPGLLL